MINAESIVLETAANPVMRRPARLCGFGRAVGLRELLTTADRTGHAEATSFVHALPRGWLGEAVANAVTGHCYRCTGIEVNQEPLLSHCESAA